MNKLLKRLYSRAASEGVVEGVIGFPLPPGNYSDDTVRYLQQELLRVLLNLVERTEAMEKGVEGPTAPLTEVTVTHQLLPAPGPFTGRNILLILGRLPAVFFVIFSFLLAQKPTNKLKRCSKCPRMFLQNRMQQYCSLACTRKAHPPRDRVRKTRERRTKWGKTKEALRQILTDQGAIERKQKPTRPWTERQLLAKAEEVLETAEADFKKAYPRKKGQEYEEEKKWLSEASKQVKRLRHKVKGY
jgi:hypothetical protein